MGRYLPGLVLVVCLFRVCLVKLQFGVCSESVGVGVAAELRNLRGSELPIDDVVVVSAVAEFDAGVEAVCFGAGVEYVAVCSGFGVAEFGAGVEAVDFGADVEVVSSAVFVFGFGVVVRVDLAAVGPGAGVAVGYAEACVVAGCVAGIEAISLLGLGFSCIVSRSCFVVASVLGPVRVRLGPRLKLLCRSPTATGSSVFL